MFPVSNSGRFGSNCFNSHEIATHGEHSPNPYHHGTVVVRSLRFQPPNEHVMLESSGTRSVRIASPAKQKLLKSADWKWFFCKINHNLQQLFMMWQPGWFLQSLSTSPWLHTLSHWFSARCPLTSTVTKAWLHESYGGFLSHGVAPKSSKSLDHFSIENYGDLGILHFQKLYMVFSW